VGGQRNLECCSRLQTGEAAAGKEITNSANRSNYSSTLAQESSKKQSSSQAVKQPS
jgi:hypothetical protein